MNYITYRYRKYYLFQGKDYFCWQCEHARNRLGDPPKENMEQGRRLWGHGVITGDIYNIYQGREFPSEIEAMEWAVEAATVEKAAGNVQEIRCDYEHYKDWDDHKL